MNAAALIALVRRFWPLVPIAALAAAALYLRAELVDARHDLALEQERANAAAERARRQRADQERGFAIEKANALELQAARLAARQPLIVHSTNSVREYAQTDAGRALCLGADRVRGIDALDARLADPDPRSAGSRDGAVRSDAGPAPAGR